MQLGGEPPWIPTVIVDRDDALSRRFSQSHMGRGHAEQRPDLYDRAMMVTRLLDELAQQASFGFVEGRLPDVDRPDGAPQGAESGTQVAIKEARMILARDLPMHGFLFSPDSSRRPARAPSDKPETCQEN